MVVDGLGYPTNPIPPPTVVVERGNDRAVRPCLNAVAEERFLIPYQRPILTLVQELLQHPCRHLALLTQNVGSRVEDGYRHEVSSS